MDTRLLLALALFACLLASNGCWARQNCLCIYDDDERQACYYGMRGTSPDRNYIDQDEQCPGNLLTKTLDRVQSRLKRLQKSGELFGAQFKFLESVFRNGR